MSYLFKFKSISSTLVSSGSVKCVLIRSYKTVEPIKALCSKRVRALVFESCNGRALGFADFFCIFHSGVYAKPCEWLHPRSVLHSTTAVYLNSSVVSQEELCRRPCNFKGANTKAISSASGVVISYCSPQRGVQRLNITSKFKRGILTCTSGISCQDECLCVCRKPVGFPSRSSFVVFVDCTAVPRTSSSRISLEVFAILLLLPLI